MAELDSRRVGLDLPQFHTEAALKAQIDGRLALQFADSVKSVTQGWAALAEMLLADIVNDDLEGDSLLDNNKRGAILDLMRVHMGLMAIEAERLHDHIHEHHTKDGALAALRRVQSSLSGMGVRVNVEVSHG